MPTTLDFALAHLDKSRQLTLDQLKDIPDDQLTRQLPGAPNHFIWVIGHLALTYDYFAQALGGKGPVAPAGYDTLFNFGSTPVGDRSKYPPLSEVLAYNEATFSAFRALAARMTEADLTAKALAGADSFLSHRLDAVLTAAWHEGWHAGQLSMLRRALGYKGTLG